MAETGVKSSVHRTSRTRALEIGTDSGKFPADPKLEQNAGRDGGQYRDDAQAAKPVESQRGPDPSPFKLGGNE